MPARTTSRTAFLALMAGAVGIAIAPLFVRWSDTGPSATAFHRLLWALPILWIAYQLESRSRHRFRPCPESPSSGSARSGIPPVSWMVLCLPGLFFAGDLALWHWSMRFTSVANATLLANLAPIGVTLAARVLFQESITTPFLAGLVTALTGAVLVMGASATLTERHLLGDLLGLATAVFYGAYILSVKYLRRTLSTRAVMLWTSVSACPALLALALLASERLWPVSLTGWVTVVSLALVSQIGGQGLIAYALAHLPASFSSVSLLVQPVVAAALAWLILGEPVGPTQALGGAVVLAGIALASRGHR